MNEALEDVINIQQKQIETQAAKIKEIEGEIKYIDKQNLEYRRQIDPCVYESKIETQTERIKELENLNLKCTGQHVPPSKCGFCDNYKKAYFEQATKIKELEAERVFFKIKEHRESEVQKLIDENKSLAQQLEELTKCECIFIDYGPFESVRESPVCQGCKNAEKIKECRG